jgi:hypothetical protein
VRSSTELKLVPDGSETEALAEAPDFTLDASRTRIELLLVVVGEGGGGNGGGTGAGAQPVGKPFDHQRCGGTVR